MKNISDCAARMLYPTPIFERVIKVAVVSSGIDYIVDGSTIWVKDWVIKAIDNYFAIGATVPMDEYLARLNERS